MTRELLNKDISDMTKKLLDMARDSSFNQISDNCFYILTEELKGYDNFFQEHKARKIENDKKNPKTLSEILVDLETSFPDPHEIDLYVYKALSNKTVIEILCIPRDLSISTSTQPTRLHCKVPIPPYASETKEKYDINWQLGPLNHKWKMFWWRRKTAKYLRQRGVDI